MTRTHLKGGVGMSVELQVGVDQPHFSPCEYHDVNKTHIGYVKVVSNIQHEFTKGKSILTNLTALYYKLSISNCVYGCRGVVAIFFHNSRRFNPAHQRIRASLYSERDVTV